MQEHGFASYEDYQSNWTTVTMLGDKARRARLGWKTTGGESLGNASYGTDDTSTHQHAMGLAIDIMPQQNAYMLDHHVEGKTQSEIAWFLKIFKDTFDVASKLYGSEPIDEGKLMDWSEQGSTEELVPKVLAASDGFRQLLEMSRRGNAREIRNALAPHYQGAVLEDRIKTITNIDTWFHMQSGRGTAKAPTNLTMDLVVALRDVAGLAWGGTEMDRNENADFMHFDCRQTDFGGKIYASGMAHRND